MVSKARAQVHDDWNSAGTASLHGLRSSKSRAWLTGFRVKIVLSKGGVGVMDSSVLELWLGGWGRSRYY